MKSVVTNFAAVFITLSACGRSEQPITCEAGHFIAGQNASVTCNFHSSVQDSGHNIYVRHYPFNASTDFSGNDVLHCFRSRQQKLQCRVKERYLFDNSITTTLTVTIPKVNEDFAGKYVCQLVPPNSKSSNVCTLTVEDTALLKQHGRRTNVHLQTGQTCVTCVIVILALCIGIVFLVGVIVAYAVSKCPTIIRKRTSTSETQTEEAREITTRDAGKATYLNNPNISVPMEVFEVETQTYADNTVSETNWNLRETNYRRVHYRSSLPLLVDHQQTCSEVCSMQAQKETLLPRKECNGTVCEVQTQTEEAEEITTRGAGKASHLNNLKRENAISETRSNLRENNSIQANHHSSLPLLAYHQRTGSEVSSIEVQKETPLLPRKEGNTLPETNRSIVTQVVSTVVGVDEEELPTCRIL